MIKYKLNKLVTFLYPPKLTDLLKIENYGVYDLNASIKMEMNKSDILKLTMEQVASYSDYITRSSVNEPWLYRSTATGSILPNQEYSPVSNSNNSIIGSIGNIAYIALKNNDESVRKEHCLLYKIYCKYIYCKYISKSFLDSFN